MRKTLLTAGFAAVLMAIPMLSLAAATQGAPAAKHTSTARATHATRGVVKSVDDSMLVISHKNGRKEEDMTFSLNASTRSQLRPASAARCTTRLTLATPTSSARAMCRFRLSCTHFKRRMSLIFRIGSLSVAILNLLPSGEANGLQVCPASAPPPGPGGAAYHVTLRR